ncbi:MAG: DUF5776 domain-containing protein [Lentilactobacillus diolivorans]|jgi:hypothetical protein|nr:DUF5776 domain-containing protein [Lentilactobacillus diolivorans]RRG03367.1 MAG: hypothetical protein DUD34_05555 [Lactobacillus sp.]
MNIRRFVGNLVLILGMVVFSWIAVPNVKADSSNTGVSVINSANQGTDYQTAITNGIGYINKQDLSKLDAWNALDLARCSQPMTSAQNDQILENLKAELNSQEPDVQAKEYGKLIIGVVSAGGDPMNFDGKNLVTALEKSSPNDIYGLGYGVMALSTNNYGDESNAIIKIWVANLLKQQKDGVWNLFSVCDDTGMVLQALAMHQDLPGVKDAIQNAEKAVAAKYYQKDTGEFVDKNSPWGVSVNSNTDAFLVTGLAACGVDVGKPLINQSGAVSPINGLLKYQQSDGGFFWQLNTADVDSMSTAEAVYALEQYQYEQAGKGSIYDFQKNPKEIIASDQNKSDAISALKSAAVARKQSIASDQSANADDQATVNATIDQIVARYTDLINKDRSVNQILTDKQSGINAINNVVASHSDIATTTDKSNAINALLSTATNSKQFVNNDQKLNLASRNNVLTQIDQIVTSYTNTINNDILKNQVQSDLNAGVLAINNMTLLLDSYNNNSGSGNVVNHTGNVGNSANPVNSTNTLGSTQNSHSTKTVKQHKRVILLTGTARLYRKSQFTQHNLIKSYLRQSRVNRPMFLIIREIAKNRYQVRDLNHGNYYGEIGYLNVSANKMTNAYYRKNPSKIKVIGTHGINSYRRSNLTRKQNHLKKGTIIKIKKVVNRGLTTRLQLKNGQYMTANKKLLIKD